MDRWSLACAGLACLAAAYVGIHPASPDLAAQAFRADLVADHGLVLWDGQCTAVTARRDTALWRRR